jgi:hypothetical protein
VRNLVIKHKYLSSSDFVENQQKFSQMFEEFLSQTDFGGWTHSRTDKKLLALFKVRSDLTIKELVASGQLQWKANAVSSPTVPMTTQVTALGTEPPLATPPTTPILANKHTCNPRGIWDTSDAATQIQLFRYMIRNAKDPQSLISEWQQHIGNVRPSGGERTVEERLAALERGSSLPQEVNANATVTVPQVSKGANASGPKSSLAMMIQERKMENRLKRKREQSEAEANKGEEQKHSKGDDV